VEKTMVRQAVPLQAMEVHAGADGCTQRRLWRRGKPTLEQAPARTCGPMERKRSTRWSRFADRACDPPTLQQPVPEGLQPMGGTHAGAVCGELSPMGGTSGWSRGRV